LGGMKVRIKFYLIERKVYAFFTNDYSVKVRYLNEEHQ